ncbi:phospholipid carrier-dependent glycosyltransferase [Opitutus sp. ER46]|uniref:phospholipid carrier-dependent glycosyltransferase n=1 Tax=Opitutus sp. ER46 TaxID=2161864 RepID=UPI000D3119FB|nr:phospholipid carrier-dependent glycosyltransferase [Opitutus sp. ER46]PTX92597.1 hypothetical protein DB354_14825 [Opitutus sp. ER46]
MNPPPGKPASRDASTTRRGEWIVFAGVALLVGWFYLWSARTEDASWRWGQPQTDYYNLLVDGFLDGQLSLKVNVPPELLAVDDPYDPAKRPPGLGLHDASLYRGKYYLYFGATPAVTLMLPFRVITGVALPLPAAVVIFSWLGFLASGLTWRELRRRYFPNGGLLLWTLGLLALGLATMVPVLVRRANIWELPLSSMYAFGALAVYALFRSLHAERRPLAWLAMASLSLGLAVASKPTHLFAVGLILVPLAVRIWAARGTWREQRAALLRYAGAALVPLGGIGLAMAWYNLARFGSVTEFGISYQFSGLYEVKARHFSWAYYPYNLWLYGFAPFEWSRYFPYLHPTQLPRTPAGFFGTEEVCATLRYVPLLWLAVLAPFGAARGAADRRRFMIWLGAVAAMGVGTLLILSGFYAAIGRYETEFMPAFVLLGLVGGLTVERWLQERAGRVVHALGQSLLALVVLAAAGFGALFSLQVYGNFARSNPRAYARLALIGNLPASWYERWRGASFGPLELEVRFPIRPAGEREPLLHSGWYGKADHLGLEYGEGRRIRFVFAHDGGATQASRWVAIDPARTYRMRVEFGSLLPPETHPVLRGRSVDAVQRLTRGVRVELAGEVLLDGYQRSEAATSDQILVGRDPKGAKDPARFSGELRAVARDGRIDTLVGADSSPCVLQFALAEVGADIAQPLLSVNTAGGPETWCVRSAGGALVFGRVTADGVRESAQITAERSRLHRLEFRCREVGGERRTWLVLDGVPVWTVAGRSFRRGDVISIGIAPAGLGRFAGRILEVEARGAAAGAVERFDQVSLRVTLPTRRTIGAREPLATTGVTGGADFLFVEYLDAARIRFGLEHWGKSPIYGAPLAWADAEPRQLAIRLGSFPGADPGAGRVEVSVNGRPMWSAPARFYRADAADVFIGTNPVGGTACSERFSGEITEVTWTARDRAEAGAR